MSDATGPNEIEERARERSIRSITVDNLPYLGPPPMGRWINIGIARNAVMDALALDHDEAAAMIGDHLGVTIPFKFARWSVVASIPVENYAGESMVTFRAHNGVPNFVSSILRGLFFWNDNVDRLQWSAGTFGGMTGGRWRSMISNKAVTIHEFTVHGAVVDSLAVESALGVPSQADIEVPAMTGLLDLAEPRKRGRPAGSIFKPDDVRAFKKMHLLVQAGMPVTTAAKQVERELIPADGASRWDSWRSTYKRWAATDG